MKTWSKPQVVELNISETANGLINVNWEGPFDLLFSDKSDSKPSTPDPKPVEDPVTDPLS